MEETARAELAVAAAARDASDYARGIAAEVTAAPGATSRIRDARRLRLLALAVLDRAVVLDLLAGASWEEVSEALMLPVDETIRRYGPVVTEWRAAAAGAPTVTDLGDATTGLPMDQHAESTAETIDAWLDRHLDPWDDRGPRLRARF